MRHFNGLFTALVFMVCLTAAAQDKKDNLAVGAHISQFQQNFGVGAHVISPYFANKKMAVKAAANLQWLQHTALDETTWTPYGNVQLGLRCRHEILEDKIFIYGEGGGVLLLPNNEFSSYKTVKGGYGLFGFEFKGSQSMGYFIELGGMGTGAKADRLSNKPIYSQGFTSSVGFRINL